MSKPAIPPAEFSRRLLRWFDRYGRHDLPWQKRKTAYRVWVSEIMLQQTQVGTVIPYYTTFLKRFPTLKALAGAHEDEVLSLWTGLGYYARARNLHKAARLIRDQHGGRFPREFEAVQDLPGIGRSTAGAILALTYDERHPILDGNVKRVLARVQALDAWPGDKQAETGLWDLAARYTPQARVADYTQAIMDLGATVCTRGQPDCPACPMTRGCRAFASGDPAAWPRPKPKGKPRPQRAVTMVMIHNDRGEVLLQKRPPTGIWGGLWSLPEVESADPRQHIGRELGLDIRPAEMWPAFVHRFSHYDLTITPLTAQLLGTRDACMEPTETVWYNPNLARDRGLARPVERLLNELRNQTWQER